MFKKSLRPIGTIASSLALVAGLSVSQSAIASEPFVGQIMLVGFTFTPRGFANCDGQLLAISTNTALFSLLGTTYGGDGRTTFGLPDLRGRVAIHTGNGPGLSQRNQGSRGGTETETLSVGQMPSHNHDVKLRGKDARGDSATPDGNSLASKSRTKIYSSAAPDVDMSAGSIVQNDKGNNQSHNNMMPYLTLRYVIALVGIYPSRN
ncbi:phage tail protein [Candidatus Colwellia aromaticivorans]|uniref:phage tail protein n=1 Tax=Candidatus Colwellia aromaticivorans TaxID=2267621 RepID=UPI000DF13E05|nr:tail fiber protein [Candidatus Colwellia aromaticivorans]